MNTLLITGTAKHKAILGELNSIKSSVDYDVWIWGNKSGNPLQMITTIKVETSGYNTLWEKAKAIGVAYFDEHTMDDGAYTIFLDHITIL